MKSIKKKWIDLQSQTRKKEAGRRRDQKKTGGGPPPDPLKSWEDKIVDVLDEDMIAGIDNGFDSMMSTMEADNSTSAYITNPTECITSTSPSRDCPANPKRKAAPEMMKDSTCKQKMPKTQESSVVSGQLLEIQEEKLEIKRKLLSLEEKKIKLLEGILHEVRNKSCCCLDNIKPPSCFEVSTVIHGLNITEI